METKEKTLLVIYPGRSCNHDSVFHLLIAETGEVLASHLCSGASFAPGDLYHNRPERIKEWSDRFGEIEIKFIDETDVSVSELLERNREWHYSLENRDANQK